MSLDKSLKIKNALRRHRNVLTRAERVQRLTEEERMAPGQSVFGLPKTKVRRLVAKKAKAAKAEEAAPVAGEEGAAPTEQGPA